MPRKPKAICVADFETDPFLESRDPQIFAWGFYDGFQYSTFYAPKGDPESQHAACLRSFVEFIKGRDCIVYFHNGGKFDIHYLLDEIERERIMCIGSRIAKARIGKAELRDSYLLIPLALKTTGVKIEIDYDYMEHYRRHRFYERAHIEYYLHLDCVALYEWVKPLIDRFGLKLTLASIAFQELKATGYEIQNTNEHYDDKFRPFYYGGRTEAFKGGYHDGGLVYYDINSAYPYAMLSNHCYGARYEVNAELEGADFVHCVAVAGGCLPYRCVDGRLRFPNDDLPREYFVTGWEIRAGFKTKTLDILEVKAAYHFNQRANFSKYVNQFYAEKLQAEKDGDNDKRLHAKLLLNSCYGKFGLNPRKFKTHVITKRGEIPNDYAEFYDTETPYTMEYHSEAGTIVWSRPEPSDTYYNVATAASITGYVRGMMWEAICESDNVLYCDTDSIICRSSGVGLGDQLGQWSVEGELDHIYIAGKKLYAGKTPDGAVKKACKGAQLDYDQIKAVALGATVEWSNIAPTKSVKKGTTFIKKNIQSTIDPPEFIAI